MSAYVDTPTPLPLIIGLSGKIGSGKTTLGDLLLAASGDAGALCNFGDALKREVAAKFGIPLERCYAQEEKNRAISDTIPMTIGEALQNVGAARRDEVPDYWIRQLGEYVLSLTATIVVIGDVRHTDEAEWVRSRNGLLVRLNGDPGGVRAASKRDLLHRSEVELDDYQHFDVVFDTEEMAAAAIATVVFSLLQSRCTDRQTGAFVNQCAWAAQPAQNTATVN